MQAKPDATDQLVLFLKAAMAPLQTQCAALDVRCKQLETQLADLGMLRERVAVTEARAPVPGPPGPAGANGTDGTNGADGLSCDELIATQDTTDERLITLAFRRGELVKTIGTLRLSTPRYCGVYEDAKAYTPGDQVTYRGSQWHCHTATSAKPGDGVTGWTLQVKCGRDGKDAR